MDHTLVTIKKKNMVTYKYKHCGYTVGRGSSMRTRTSQCSLADLLADILVRVTTSNDTHDGSRMSCRRYSPRAGPHTRATQIQDLQRRVAQLESQLQQQDQRDEAMSNTGTKEMTNAADASNDSVSLHDNGIIQSRSHDPVTPFVTRISTAANTATSGIHAEGPGDSQFSEPQAETISSDAVISAAPEDDVRRGDVNPTVIKNFNRGEDLNLQFVSPVTLTEQMTKGAFAVISSAVEQVYFNAQRPALRSIRVLDKNQSLFYQDQEWRIASTMDLLATLVESPSNNQCSSSSSSNRFIYTPFVSSFLSIVSGHGWWLIASIGLQKLG